MASQKVSVTEFSKGLSDFLNLVQYRGQVFEIERGKRVVAQVSPVSQKDGFPIAEINALLKSIPSLSASERQSFARDLKSVRSALKTRADPWA